MIDVLFDYDPAWFPPDTVPASPVSIEAMPAETDARLAEIARDAEQHQTLTDRQRAAIQAVLHTPAP